MNANTQNTKETNEQFAKRMRSAPYNDENIFANGGGNPSLVRATKVLTDVTRELGIKQAEMTDRLATAMEAIANQQQRQSDLLGLLVDVSTSKDQQDNSMKGVKTDKKASKRDEFTRACGRVFGEKRFREPTIQCIEGLNLYFNTIRYSKDAYKVYFLPESWAYAMHKDGRKWPECDWSGIYKQPLMADLCFYANEDANKENITYFGQLIVPPSDVRLKIVECISNAAEHFSYRAGFGPKYNPKRKQSGFFMNNTYKLNGKCDAESLAEIMKEAIRDYTPAIDAIGEALAGLDLSR